jgi:hypothetical protein
MNWGGKSAPGSGEDQFYLPKKFRIQDAMLDARSLAPFSIFISFWFFLKPCLMKTPPSKKQLRVRKPKSLGQWWVTFLGRFLWPARMNIPRSQSAESFIHCYPPWSGSSEMNKTGGIMGTRRALLPQPDLVAV